MASATESSPFGSLYFPLASNAHSLLAGRPVESVRARMKAASLLYDRVYVEAGSLTIQAGPYGASTWRSGPEPEDAWQTARARKLSQQSSFSISIAAETVPGVAATDGFTQILNSPATVAWAPTFHPFREELPADCDWLEFVSPPQPSDEWKKFVHKRKGAAMEDPALQRSLPIQFVRSQVFDNSSTDLGVGSAGGAAVSMDSLHASVIRSRFARDAALRSSGFALPLLMPRASALPWSEVARLRKAKGMAGFRSILREVEHDALATVETGGDLERQIEVEYRKRLIQASRQVERLGGVLAVGGAEIVIGIGVGLVTTGVVGLAVGAVPGVLTTAWAARRIANINRQQAWIAVADSLNT